MAARSAGIAVGLMADRLLPEPSNRWHPVALFGTTMAAVEQRLWADDRGRGVLHALLGAGMGAGVGRVLERMVGGRFPGLDAAIAVNAVVAGSELRRVGRTIGALASEKDLAGARAALPSLVGRDPSALDASGVAAAVIESLAENEVDAVIAPLFWTALFGATGAGFYRAVNTMDAMVGHRSERYERYGWAAARLDDVANYLPARCFAVAVCLSLPSAHARSAWHIVRRDAPGHPSPNAGVAESVVAAAIGRQLGGTLRYGDRVEHRPLLGDGSPPTPADVDRVATLTERIEAAIIALALGISLFARRRP